MALLIVGFGALFFAPNKRFMMLLRTVCSFTCLDDEGRDAKLQAVKVLFACLAWLRRVTDRLC